MYALIVDPDAGRSEHYLSLARNLKIESVVARDGKSALDFVRVRGSPRVVLTELSLPKLDGFGLIEQLRSNPATAKVPVIVVSGHRALRDLAVRRKNELGIAALFAKSSPLLAVHRALRDSLFGSPAEAPLALAEEPASPPSPAPASLALQPDGSFVAVAPAELTEAQAPETAASIEIELSLDDVLDSPEPERRAEEEQRERRRLAALASMNLVDDLPPDEGLQRLVESTAKAFDVPIALVSLVLEDRQWFKAHVGLQGDLLEQRGSAREISFCRHVVENDEPLVVPDAQAHPCFQENPLVTGGLIRGYAGVPLKTPGGDVLGTLCVVDDKPLRLGAEGLEALALLARRVAGELELRHGSRKAAAALAEKSAELDTLRAVMGNLEEGVMVLDEHRSVLVANEAVARFLGVPLDEIVGRPREEILRRASAGAMNPAEFLRVLAAPAEGPFAARAELRMAQPARRVLRWIAKPVPVARGVLQMSVFVDVTAQKQLAAAMIRLARAGQIPGAPRG